MLTYWFMFPLAAAVSMFAMALGVGVAALFTPLLYLVLDIPASVAVGSGLLLETFGFGAGLIGFAREKLIDYDVGIRILLFTIPAAVVGAYLTRFIPDDVILTALVFLFSTLGYIVIDPANTLTLKQYRRYDRCHDDTKACWNPPGSLRVIIPASILGGLFDGMVSTGVAEMNDFIMFEEYNMHGPIAAGTSVFIAAFTVLVGFGTHAYSFITQHPSAVPTILYVAIYAIPGVLLGSELGVKLSHTMDDSKREVYIGVLYLLLAVFTAAVLILA